MTINEIKDIVYKEIEIERKKKNIEYDNNKLNISQSRDLPSVMKELVDIYGNSVGQSNLMIELLEKYSNVAFISNSRAERKLNSVRFHDFEYYIDFSTSRSHLIEVGLVAPLIKVGKKPSLKKGVLEIYELAVNYIETGKDKDYDKLINLYSWQKRNKASTPLYKWRTKEDDVIEYVLSNKIYVDNLIVRTREWEAHVKELEDKKHKYDIFIKSLDGFINDFKNAGWTIKVKGADEN